MQNIKSRNLYLPVLHKTKFFQHKQTHHSSSQIDGKKNDVNDLLKLLQLKKAQLQKNFQDDDSDYSSDNQNNNHKLAQQDVQLHQRNKAMSVLNYKLSNFQEKLKTALDQKVENQQRTNTEGKKRYFRVRTQHNQISSKSTHNATQISKKIKLPPKQNSKPLIKFLKPKQMSRQLSKIIPNIPTKIKQRNQDSLKQVVQFLQQFNPFFMKMDRIVATCLLKVCKIVKKGKRQTIYEKQTPMNKFYIILSGRVKISNKQIDLRKICVPGQSILQETWINLNQTKQQTFLSLQKARSVGDSYLLEIPLQKMQKVKQELTRFGFKVQYYQIEALIKRNYIVKNTLRVQKNKF